jgi:2-polyprenyl-6-hydroxyphenyl methylase/3-demethylubiquinone-9 3-methyltransferase
MKSGETLMPRPAASSESELRFAFGQNWTRYLAALDESRIDEAMASLNAVFEVHDLDGARFLDVGSGSGLFSLAARRLGATVVSFDYDPDSVWCTQELKRRYFPDDDGWRIHRASALDSEFINGLGTFDLVYSYGVLHHTGDQWRALGHVEQLVRPGGKFYVALYNDTGTQSGRWQRIKRFYNNLPAWLRPAFAAAAIAPEELKAALSAVVRLKPGEYVRSWTRYRSRRGMSKWRDIIDWVGGYPYEVSTPDEVFDYFRARGYELVKLRCGRVGLGCNEFVFLNRRPSPAKLRNDATGTG